MLDLIKMITEGNVKIGITALNNVGVDGSKQLVKELKKSSLKRKNTFIEKSKGIDSEIVIDLLQAANKTDKLKELTPLILKSHTRAIRKYCHDEKLDYNNFIKNFQ